MFVQHMVASLKSDGRMAVVMPHGVLFRGGEERACRQKFIKDGNLEAVIGLPAGLFYGTGIPACVLVINKNDSAKRKSVLFINADREYKEGKNQNSLRPEDIEKITHVYHKRLSVPKYSREVPVDELEWEEFNLNIRRYVDNIIPDIVLFVNGLPLAVIECKEANAFTSNPMFEAFQQLMRYSDQREETKQSGLREGEPRLFFTNQLLIRTSGEQADIGTITSTDEEFSFPWRDIYPEKYLTFTPPLGKARPQETLIQGVLPKETLLDLIRTCSIFMDVGKVRAKVVARYQQYRAVCRIIDRLRKGKTPNDRSGVIWHTQGSGKSLTMVFVIRKLRMCDDLKDYKVCLVNDRTDLEDQLGDTAALTGEKVTFIASSHDLKQKLATDSSNLNMVMLHKFNENPNRGVPDYLQDVIDLPKYESFGMVNRMHSTSRNNLRRLLFQLRAQVRSQCRRLDSCASSSRTEHNR
jgi:type I site-specific restriction-modification system R (restriction) subunit